MIERVTHIFAAWNQSNALSPFILNATKMNNNKKKIGFVSCVTVTTLKQIQMQKEKKKNTNPINNCNLNTDEEIII